jgi:prepilin-type N-terminal cleavage/methylation domain-containing protein
MRLKHKGFTLVELLVTIVILGIITGISIPIIRNIQAHNQMRKYTTYMDSLKTSAKLFMNSYEEDLFGHSKSGCVIINYSQMEE